MFYFGVRSHWLLAILWGLLLGGNPGAAADLSLEQWDQGLILLDEGRATAAADYFYNLLEQQPRRLDLLDGCFRAERRLNHADSVQTMVQRRVLSALAPGSPGARFFAAETLRKQKLFPAAADSFQELARTCHDQGDFLSAQTAMQMACRCRFDSKDPALIRYCSQAIIQGSSTLPHHPRLQIETNIIIANSHFLLDELDQAEPMYQSLLDSVQTLGYAQLQLDLLNALGSLTSKQRRQDESLDYYQQSLAIARKLDDGYRLCLVLTNLSHLETSRRNFDSANAHLLEAQTLAEDYGFNKFLGTIQSGLGAVAEMSGNRLEAVRRFRAALVLNEQTDNPALGVGTRQRLAFNLAMMGQYTEAQSQYETCLEILDKQEGMFILNWVLGGLAITNHKLGYLDRAAELYRRAHSVNIDMGDQLSAAWCLNSLGLIQALRGDYRQALITHNQAWQQYNNLGDREGAGYALASSADVYLLLGDFQAALKHCKTVLTLAEEIQSDELLRKASQTMASIYSDTGKARLAELNFLRVIDISRNWHELVVEIWALNGLAKHYLSRDRREEARGCLQTALDLMAGREYYHVRSETCRLLALAADSPSQAVPWAEQARELAEAGSLPELEWKALSDLGAYHFKQGQFQQAESSLQSAITLVEGLRRKAGSDQLQRHMLRPALLPYERLVQLRVTGLNDAAGAFVTSERSRAQILANRLHAALAHNSNQPTRATDPEERGLSATITFLQTRLQDAHLGKALRDSLRRQVAELENEFALLKLRWSAEDEIDTAVLFPKTPQAKLLQRVLKRKEHLLSYFLGTDQSFLFSVSHDKIKAYVLPPRNLLEEKIMLFLRLQKHAATGKSPLPENVLLTARKELYSLLIKPAENDFSNASTLVIAPDGLLHRLPFAYLHDGESFLFERNELFTVPSLQTLGFLRQRAESSSLEQTSKTILAIGCGGSEREGMDKQDRLHPFTDAPVPRLSQVDAEAWRLAKLFNRAQILTGNAANEQKIRSGVLASADIIHIAAHSYADETDSRRSYILLNRSPVADPEDTANLFDGLLVWHEIVGLDLNASLVTLATCRSAGGMLTNGEGIMGLTQAFILAGSRCVLASQTDVPDGETRWFMDLFYGELRSGSTAAAALRTVRLQALRQTGAGSGYLPGCGFVLTGDGTVAYAGQPSNLLVWALVFGFLVIALLVLRRLR